MKQKNINKKGITLIALVITVIVLLILAGAVVATALNKENLFEKTNDAKTEWNKKVAEEQEITDKLLGKLNMFNTNNIIDNVKKAKAITYGAYSDINSITLLKQDGKLFYMSSLPMTSGYIQYSDENAILVAENVKEHYEDGYFLTNNNELYAYKIVNSSSDNTLVAENVKKYFGIEKGFAYINYIPTYYGAGYYIDSNDDLYRYDTENNNSTLLGNNVKDIAFAYDNYSTTTCYLTNDKKLYASNGNLIDTNVEKVFWCDRNSDRDYECYYIKSDKNLYNIRFTGPIGNQAWNGVLYRH